MREMIRMLDSAATLCCSVRQRSLGLQAATRAL